MGKNIQIKPFPDDRASFFGMSVPETCVCCEFRNANYVICLNGNRTKLCKDCLNELYEETGRALKKSVKEGDTIWELSLCDDNEWRVFPMSVKSVAIYGSVRWVKGKEPNVWNIYAESAYTYMYANFYEQGERWFVTEEDAQKALKEKQTSQIVSSTG